MAALMRNDDKMFFEIYRELVAGILDRGANAIELNRRTGERVAIGPLDRSMFAISLRDRVLPTIGLRRTRPSIAAAELAWCLRGERSIRWMRKYTRVWNDFAEKYPCFACVGGLDHGDICRFCDGTGERLEVDAAYGYRWREAFGRDQLNDAMKALAADPTDRRIWVSSWHPGADGLGAKNQKTVPCPVGFTLSVIDGRLNSMLTIRSSDVFMGLPIDVMRHALLMSAMAATLGVELGVMQVALAHPHIYERHWELALEMLAQVSVVPFLPMPRWTIGEIAKRSDDYMLACELAWADAAWPAFDPRLKVVK